RGTGRGVVQRGGGRLAGAAHLLPHRGGGSRHLPGSFPTSKESADMTDYETAPADRLRESLRESAADTPIGEQAAAAVRVRSGSEVFPLPASRRVITVANQKGGVGK